MDQNGPTFSVVVPVYNKAAHIARSFGSIFAQTYPPAEIIAVDDGSTDGSRALLEAIDDRRFKLISSGPPNVGPGAARNMGIRAATSTWVAFLDADDEWTPGFLAEVARIAVSADERVSAIFTGFENEYGDRRILHEYVSDRKTGVQRLSLGSYIRAWLDVERSPIHTSSVAIRRSTLHAAGLFPEGPEAFRGEDITLWLKCVAHGDAISSPFVGAIYHRDATNMVTKSVRATGRPVICSAIEELIPKRDRTEKGLLKSLNNHIVYDYARISSRSERVSFSVFKNIYFFYNIKKIFILAFMSIMHPNITTILRRVKMRKLRDDV